MSSSFFLSIQPVEIPPTEGQTNVENGKHKGGEEVPPTANTDDDAKNKVDAENTELPSNKKTDEVYGKYNNVYRINDMEKHSLQMDKSNSNQFPLSLRAFFFFFFKGGGGV